MTRARAPIENPKLGTKRTRLERGEQSREETSDGKGKRREAGGGGGGDESIFVISSDDDVRSSADDVREEGSHKSKFQHADQKGKRRTTTTYSKSESSQRSRLTCAKTTNSQLEPGQSSRLTRAKTTYSKPEPGQNSRLTRAKTAYSKSKPDQSSRLTRAKRTYSKTEADQSCRLTRAKSAYSKPETGQSSRLTRAKTAYSKSEPGQSSKLTRAKTTYSKPEPGQSSKLTRAKTAYSKPEPNQSSKLTHAKTTYSKPEPNQSSGLTHAKTLCKICMDLVPTTQIFTINPCNHLFCNSCMVHYITSKLDQNIASIPCPELGCKSGPLDMLTCQCILPSDTFDKWSSALCVSSLGLNKFYCPFKDCSALLLADGCEEVRNSECPHCNRMFCARCNVPWHGEMSCEEFQRLGEDERGREDLMLRNLAKEKMWQRCPQCRMYVEKIDGCMFMQCRCGYCFCYVCATPMSKQTHYCTTCKR